VRSRIAIRSPSCLKLTMLSTYGEVRLTGWIYNFKGDRGRRRRACLVNDCPAAFFRHSTPSRRSQLGVTDAGWTHVRFREGKWVPECRDWVICRPPRYKRGKSGSRPTPVMGFGFREEEISAKLISEAFYRVKVTLHLVLVPKGSSTPFRFIANPAQPHRSKLETTSGRVGRRN
jgi:hypothetical protein